MLPTLYFGDVLFGINNFYMRDLTRYYYPTKQVLREIVLGGGGSQAEHEGRREAHMRKPSQRLRGDHLGLLRGDAVRLA